MKVILIKDVPHLGQVGAVKKVAAGFGRHYLLPRGLAVLATPAALKVQEARSAKQAKEKAVQLEAAKVLVGKLKDVKLNIYGLAEKETFFGSVGPKEIAAALAELGFVVPESAVSLPKPLKTLGEYAVKIHYAPEVEATVSVILKAAVDKTTKVSARPKVKATKAKVASKKKVKPPGIQ